MSTKADTTRLTFHARVGASLAPYLRRQVRRILALRKSPLRELSVVLVNDKQIGELHDEFFGDPTTTDVITFPMEQDRRGRALSGELYVCVPMARRQAKALGVQPGDELLLYVLHGILHLDGLDDMTDAGYKRMHKMEDQILTQLGIGAVFAANASPRPGGRP